MEKPRFTIGRKIFGGFIFLISIFFLNAAISIYTINKSNQVVSENTDVIAPSVKAIDEFILLVTESKMLITNWVYLQNNTEDKEALKELHNFRYPELKNKLTGLQPFWEDSIQIKTVDSLITNFEELIEIEKDVMSQLVTFEDYEDAMIKWQAAEAIEMEVLPRTQQLKKSLYHLSNLKRKEADEAQASIVAAANQMRNITFILGSFTIIIGLFGAFWVARGITRPINFLKQLIQRLSKGELPEKEEDESKEQKFNDDEVGDMAIAVDDLVEGLRATSGFAEQIGQGNYKADFDPLSENDVLGNALLNMRDNLKKVAEDDKKRNWATEGTAKFGEILRQHNHSVSDLSNTILTNLLKYVGANQGGLYIVQDTESGEPYMTLESCFAWDKKKYVEQKIYKGEGLVGQAWQEKDTIFITEVPESYITITSGLGDANPTCILIVPLLVNDQIYGAIEMASFTVFKDYEVDFLKRIAESIASTISSAKTNSRTQKLLEESTEMTEQMRSQEEEMRQNMEELQATQEELSRKQKSMMERESRIKAVLDTALAAFISIDAEGYLDFYNKNTEQLFGYSEDQLSHAHISKLLRDVSENNTLEYLQKYLDTEERHMMLNSQGEEFEAEIRFGEYNLDGKIYYIARIIESKAYASRAEAKQEA